MVRFIAVAALALVAMPAHPGGRAHSPQQYTAALKAACSVQHVHTAAGRNGHQPAIRHCKRSGTVEVARAVPVPVPVPARAAPPAVGLN